MLLLHLIHVVCVYIYLANSSLIGQDDNHGRSGIVTAVDHPEKKAAGYLPAFAGVDQEFSEMNEKNREIFSEISNKLCTLCKNLSLIQQRNHKIFMRNLRAMQRNPRPGTIIFRRYNEVAK